MPRAYSALIYRASPNPSGDFISQRQSDIDLAESTCSSPSKIIQYQEIQTIDNRHPPTPSQHILLRLPPLHPPNRRLPPLIPQRNIDLLAHPSVSFPPYFPPTTSKPAPQPASPSRSRTTHPKPTHHLQKRPREHHAILQPIRPPTDIPFPRHRGRRRRRREDTPWLEQIRIPQQREKKQQPNRRLCAPVLR